MIIWKDRKAQLRVYLPNPPYRKASHPTKSRHWLKQICFHVIIVTDSCNLKSHHQKWACWLTGLINGCFNNQGEGEMMENKKLWSRRKVVIVGLVQWRYLLLCTCTEWPGRRNCADWQEWNLCADRFLTCAMVSLLPPLISVRALSWFSDAQLGYYSRFLPASGIRLQFFKKIRHCRDIAEKISARKCLGVILDVTTGDFNICIERPAGTEAEWSDRTVSRAVQRF